MASHRGGGGVVRAGVVEERRRDEHGGADGVVVVDGRNEEAIATAQHQSASVEGGHMARESVPIAQDDVEKLGRLLALAHPLAELADVVDQPELERDV